MPQPAIRPDAFCQVALVVRDIETVSRQYADLFGVAPPDIRTTGPYDETGASYRGKPTDARAKLAFFDIGSVRLELIEPIGGPSIWQEHLDRNGEGVHHIAFHVDDAERARTQLAQRDMPVAQEGQFPGGGYLYIDSAGPLKLLLELLYKRPEDD